MECRSYSLSRLPHATPLLGDYLQNFPRVSEFYAHPPTREGVLAAAVRARPSPDVRDRVATILLEQNRFFGADAAVEQNLERFRKGAVAVVTGQQVGLFSGPAYTFYKALAAVRLAAELTESGTDAVPIFWMATEDHDLAEVDHTFWATRSGIERIELNFPEESAGRPVGGIDLPDEIAPLVEQVCARLEGPSTPSVTRALQGSYRKGETLGSAFARLLTQLFTGRGLILIDPLDSRLHRLVSGLYSASLESADVLGEKLLERAEQLGRSGYHPQVRVTDESTLLFWTIDGRRLPVERRGGRLQVADFNFSFSEFQEALYRQPERSSGNVLLRPVLQDALLGTVAYIGGAAEVAYLAQAEVIYRQLGVPMPAILPRPGFTLIEGPLERLLGKYHLEITDVFEGRQHLRSQMERESLPGDLLERFASGETSIRQVLANLRDPLIQLDSTLGGALETVENKILYQYTKLHEKAGRAIGMRTGVLDRHEQLLTDLLYPHHGLQERTLCFLPMLAWQGMPLLDALQACASPGAGSHQVITFPQPG